MTQLLSKGPPEEYIPNVKLMKARVLATRDSPNAAYLELIAIASRYPQEHWSAKDLSFFHALEHALNLYYDDLIAKAKRFLMAGFYTEAISMYQDILSSLEKGGYPKAKTSDSLIAKKIRYRLAECHFLAADYESTLSICANKEGGEDKIDREMLYLCALCYREKKDMKKPWSCCQNYSHLADMGDLDHYEHALFEIGYHYYQNGQTAKARGYFEKLQHFNSRPGQLAALKLARIHLDEGKPREVEKLFSVINTLNAKDPLRYECYYLRGLAAYTMLEYTRKRRLF